ncbi:permease-like cell division protein FtsX [Desulfitibacter alkalitolerans]|uniref:permease-like cell division protein FtsX n=1 Tax=Desulfitibacter alkalitolerans TaxID=264641 RepID=UPI0004897F8F|nr:permease-like cell division protein FtsX [Desulfitibacter alkalitolerans]
MRPRTIIYFFKQAGKSLFRHGWMGAASVLTTAIALLIFGVFALVMMNINLISGHVESTLEIVVWLESDADKETAENVGTYLQNLSQVTQVRYVPKEEGLEQLSREFGGSYDLLWTLGGENPLPDFYVVKVSNPELVKAVAQRIAGLPPVEKVDYGQDYLDKVLSLLYWVRMVGLGLTSLLAAAAIFLIGNTVRLTVYARSNEITIMKYIGATNWFVRWPFLLEGMFLGAIGAGIAAASVYFGYNVLVEHITPAISFIPLIQDKELLLNIAGLLVIIGTLLGGMASYLSLGRYLRF